MPEQNELENEDKKAIEEEEREQMLNKENVLRLDSDKIEDIDKIDKEKELEKEKEAEGEAEKDGDGLMKTGEVEKRKKQLEESQKESRLSSIRVPIGGIKIPGFLRSKSRDKNKDADGMVEEGVDLLEQSTANKDEKTDKPEKSEGKFRATLTRGLDSIAARNPFVKKDSQGQEPSDAEAGEQQTHPRASLLQRIKLPNVNVFSKTNKEQKDATGASAGGGDEKPESPDDGMESVKLDGDDEKDPEKAGLAGDVPKRPIYLQYLDRARNATRHEKIVAGVVALLLLLLIIITAVSAGGPIPTAPPIVDGKVVTTTQCGPVQGTQEKEAFVFYGIPYAAPPVNQRRWKPAQALNNLSLCWDDEIFEASKPSTTRQCLWESAQGSIDGFEDCLYLDIWTPEVRYINPVPVVVLIDTVSLSGGPQGVLTPTFKVVHDREVVFVRPNFRVGIFGFLAATALSQAVHPPSSGNYGLSDIVVALKWVQTNIAHFGGDPSQVTLVGHRAGATLVTALSASSAAAGLFKRAWASSGSAMFPGEAVQVSEVNSQSYVDRVCPARDTAGQLSCLMELEAETALKEVEASWKSSASNLPSPDEATKPKHDWLVLDGNILRTHIWSEEAERHATLVVGTTAHSEGSAELRGQLQGVTEEAIVAEVRKSVLGSKNLADEVLTKYNATWEGFASMVSDIRTVCPLLTMTRAQANVTFYVVTQTRKHTELGSLADPTLDMSAILGWYAPTSEPQQTFVKTIQNIFFDFVLEGMLPALPVPAPAQPVLKIANTTEWRSDYPNCGYWVAKEIVPLYARRD